MQRQANLNSKLPKLLARLTVAFLALALSAPLCAQSTTTFQYFYDDDGQLIKVIDSSGNLITYNYDQVGNITSITRGQAPASGTLAIFDFTPQMGPAGTNVTIQGQGFNATPSSNTVQFNGALATVISATTSTLVVSVPASATTGPISVTVATATATSSSNFTFIPTPTILSVTPRGVVSSPSGITTANLQVTGAYLTNSTFSFAPASNPSPIQVSSATVNPGGTSATLSIAVAPGIIGNFALVATTSGGSSSQQAGPNNTLQVLDPNADTDGDGLTNAVEAAIGTDPLNPTTSGVGLPDGWQVFYGLNPLTPATATVIAPDGLTILQNFQISHDPTNSSLAPPTVSQVAPANGATKVPINDSVVVRFNEPLLIGTSLVTAQTAIAKALGSGTAVPAAGQQIAAQTLQAYMNRTCCGTSVLPGTVTVTGPNGGIAGTVSSSSDGTSVTFAPSQPLLSNTTFAVQSQALRDAAGNRMTQVFRSSFTTGATLDKTGPQVVSSNPANDATNVPTSVSIVVTFSKAINPASVTPASFYLNDITTGSPVAGQIQVDSTNTIITLVPSQPLVLNQLYSATVTTGVTDLAGNNLPASFLLGFATGPIQGPGEADSTVFSVLNGALPTGATVHEADSVTFSIQNGAAPVLTSQQEADSVNFSLLNSAVTIGVGQTQEADSITFSVLNGASSITSQVMEADSISFSVSNGTAIVPITNFEADSVNFSVQNGPTGMVRPAKSASVRSNSRAASAGAIARNGTAVSSAMAARQSNFENQPRKGDSHGVKFSHWHKVKIRLFGLAYRRVGVPAFSGNPTPSRADLQ
jgi:YD repeat-containing protein